MNGGCWNGSRGYRDIATARFSEFDITGKFRSAQKFPKLLELKRLLVKSPRVQFWLEGSTQAWPTAQAEFVYRVGKELKSEFESVRWLHWHSF